MTWPNNLQMVPSIVASIALLFVMGHVWRNRTSFSDLAVRFVLLFAALEWVLADFLTIVTTDAATKTFWDNMHYIGAAIVPATWYILAILRVDGSRSISRNQIVLVYIVPVVTIVLAFTNDHHGLIRRPLGEDMPLDLVLGPKGFGPAVWVYIFYAYTLVGLSLLRIARAIHQTGKLRLWQLAGLIVAGLTAALVSVWDFVIIHPAFEFEITPLVAGVAMSFLTFHQRWLQRQDILPVAAQAIMESMTDAVIVMSTDWRILSMNPAAEHLAQALPAGYTGLPVAAVWPQLHTPSSPSESVRGERQVLVRGEGVNQQVFDAVLSSVMNRAGEVSGQILVLRDITLREQTNQRMLQLNADLAAEIEEHRQTEQKLRLLLEEKEVLLQEIHHRVKNNLQVISSLLSLQSSFSDPQLKAPLQESQNRVLAMALVHERLYQSDNMASLNLSHYIPDLCQRLVTSYRIQNVVLETHVEPLNLDIETTVTLGLIINEMVSNALKHAFSNGKSGTITVGFKLEGDQLVLQVCDTGVGLPPGFDANQTRSLGLRLIATLTRQLKGTLEVRSECGACFVLHIPKSPALPESSYAITADFAR